MRTFMLPASVVAALLALASSASANPPSATDKAASDSLFKEAKALMAEGHVNDACPKLEESQRLDPTPGTLLNLGDCYERSTPTRTASAWGAFRQAEAMSRQRGDADRQAEAARRAEPIEPVLSKVVLSVAPGGKLPGLEVKWDGNAIGAGRIGSAFPVDSGEHTIEAGAPDHKSWTGKVVVKINGGTTKVEIPALALGASNAVPGTMAPEVPFWSTQRTLGLGAGVVGLAGVVVGSIYGVKAGNKNAESLPHCQPTNSNLCDAQGVAFGEDAIVAGNTSTVAFLVGGAALLGGTILFFTARSGPVKSAITWQHFEVQPMVGPSFGGISLHTTW
jgi:serine/threonine-protein kinase